MSVFIYCEERKRGRKEDRAATVRRGEKFATNKKWGDRKLKPWKQRVSIEKGFGFGLYGRIKFIRSELYGGDRAENYFIFISILKLRKIILL